MEIVVGLTAFVAASLFSVETVKGAKRKDFDQQPEGPIQTAEIISGPFDLHRKYRSMEGPWVRQTFRVGDLVNSKNVTLPETMVTFVEGNPQGAPSMNGGGADPKTAGKPIGLEPLKGPRELYWFKGIKLEVLDENDKPLPTAEFICHMNLDVDRNFRNKAFPEGERTVNPRLISLTQGQTEFIYPEGFAVPVASDEPWTFIFQAANRTSEQHRRVKHRCTVWFIKDSELVRPVKALHWYVPYITVVVDKESPKALESDHTAAPDCLGMSDGVAAPNNGAMSTFTDALGRRLNGHWVVPPGIHTYTTAVTDVRDRGFASQDRSIQAVWSHIHPLCTSASLVECDAEGHRKVFEVKSQTKTKGGLEIKHIDNILSKQGIPLQGGRHYELQATYNNTTGQPQDSMVSIGIMFADDKFARPNWCFADKNVVSCGIEPPQSALNNAHNERKQVVAAADAGPQDKNGSVGANRFPLFDINRDGPILTQAKELELETTAGKIHLVLDPSLAPEHATQLYRLFKSGAFDGTPFFRYETNFVLQVALAETKADGHPIANELRNLMRRLPLEVGSQSNGPVGHKKWMLTMARDAAPDSAVSSFSVLLTDAPHLDGKYTVFGRIVPDAVTLHTLAQITQEWPANHPRIVRATELQLVAGNF